MTSRGQEQRRRPAKSPSKPALPVREILAAAARAFRRSLWRIVGVAVVVSLATALVEIAVTNLVDHSHLPLAAVGELTSSAVSVLGAVFLSGFLSRVVSESEHGGEECTLGQVIRTLPWRRLITADLLVAALVVAGLIALVIPGLAIMTLLAVVGPVIEIEDRDVRAAVRRSVHLVWPYFWWVALLATAPVAAYTEFEFLTPEPHTVEQILQNLAIRGVGLGLLEAVIGVVLVELYYQLIAMDRLRASRGLRVDCGSSDGGRDGDWSPQLRGAGTQPNGYDCALPASASTSLARPMRESRSERKLSRADRLASTVPRRPSSRSRHSRQSRRRSSSLVRSSL
jgi:hypothetical protein